MNRDLGACERLYWLFNQWSPNNVIAVCELDGTLDPALLPRALAALQQRHPLLALRVVPDARGSHPRFVRHGTGDLPLRVVQAAPGLLARELDQQIDEELNRWLDPRVALARALYIQDGTQSALVLCCLHIVADATSALLALRDLLGAHAALLGRAEAQTPAPRLPKRPAHAALLPPQYRGARGLPALLGAQLRLVGEQLRDRPARLRPERDVALVRRQNRYLRRLLPPAQVSALKRACGAQQVTVHGLLSAALAIALGDELALRDRPRAMLNLGSPVSLRPQLAPALGDELGSYVCTLNMHLDVGRAQELWSVARQANRELERRRGRDEQLALMQLVEWIAPASRARSRRAMALTEQSGPGNVCLSNIGHFDFPLEVAGIAVRAAHWTASLSVTGYVLCAVCTTPRGLALDFSYMEGSVSAPRARRIVERTLSRLTQVTEAYA